LLRLPTLSTASGKEGGRKEFCAAQGRLRQTLRGRERVEEKSFWTKQVDAQAGFAEGDVGIEWHDWLFL
jgi:hypothetical protein